MAKLDRILGLFTVRNRISGKPLPALGKPFRIRLLQFTGGLFTNDPTFIETSYVNTMGDQSEAIWEELHKKLSFLYAMPKLSNRDTNSRREDLRVFILESATDGQVVDFIESIFHTTSAHLLQDTNVTVKSINQLFALDGIGLHLTDQVAEWRENESEGSFSRSLSFIIHAEPQVIRREDDISHEVAIEPMLTLLADPRFKYANSEMLAALRSYRLGNFEHSLTECGSAYESVMKVICAQRKWAVKSTDRATELLDVILEKRGIATYFKNMLLAPAQLRNRFSSAHGAGTEERHAEAHIARWAISQTAGAILFLVAECGERT